MTAAPQARLQAMKTSLEDRIGRLVRDQRHADEPVDKDMEEQATQREHDDVVDELLREARRELVQVERALARIAGGQYGYCTACGVSIGEARLAAIPEATLCINCAS